MRFVPQTLIALAIIWPANISWGDVRPECDDVPELPEAMLTPYLKKGPYAVGLRRHQAGVHKDAAKRLQKAWGNVRRELRSAFGSGKCRSEAITRAIDRNLRRMPPLAVAATDRFLPPVVVRDAVARSLCLSGDRIGAARWLMDAALSGDGDSARAASSLYGAAGLESLSMSVLFTAEDPKP